MRIVLLFVGFLGASLVPAPAGAEGTVGTILPRVDGKKACFGRIYDSKHLKAHKDQKVTEMGFRLAFVAEKFDDGRIYQSYRYQLTARLRGQAEAATARGECGEYGGKSFCGVECDGGGVYVSPRPDGSILVHFSDSHGIRMASGCDEDEEAEFMLEPGKDDKSFRLARLADDQCPAYADW